MQLTAEQIKLVNILEQFYRKPVTTESALLYTTADIFSRLQSIYPSDTYTLEDLFNVLTYLEFETIDSITYRQIMWYIQEQK
jgi:hypothetical protein